MLPLRDPTTIFACLPGCLPTSQQPASTLLFRNPPVTPFRTESPASCGTEISQCNSSQVSKVVPIAIRATDYLRFCLSNSHSFEGYRAEDKSSDSAAEPSHIQFYTIHCTSVSRIFGKTARSLTIVVHSVESPNIKYQR